MESVCMQREKMGILNKSWEKNLPALGHKDRWIEAVTADSTSFPVAEPWKGDGSKQENIWHEDKGD